MTSQISLIKLMRRDFVGRRWTFILSAVTQLILGPIAMLFALTTNGDNKNMVAYYKNIEDAFIITYGLIGSAIIIVGSIILALVGYRFLFSKKMMDLYGSIPVSRNKMFIGVYLNNVLIWFIPFIVSLGLSTIIACSYVPSLSSYTLDISWKILVGSIIGFLSFYHLCLVGTMLSGHPFVAIVNIVLIGTVAIAIYGLSLVMKANYFMTFVEPKVLFNSISFLSPVYTAVYIPNMIAGFIDKDSQTVVVIAGTVIVLIINFALAMMLYKKRDSELAENGTKNKIYSFVIRPVVSVLCGIALALALAIIMGSTNIIWSVVGVVIGTVASFGIINIIFNRKGSAFFKNKFLMIGSLVCAIAIFMLVIFDGLGYDTYIPAKQNIVSANIYFPSYSDGTLVIISDDGTTISQDYSEYESRYRKYSTDDVEKIYELLEIGVRNIESSKDNSAEGGLALRKGFYYGLDDFASTMYITVKLSNGSEYIKSYGVTMSDLETVADIVESKEYREIFYAAESNKIPTPDRIVIYANKYYDYEYEDSSIQYAIEDEDMMALLIEIYQKDFAEASIIEIESILSSDYLQLHYKADRYADVNPDYYDEIFELKIYENFERTNEALELIDSYETYQLDDPDVIEEINKALEEIMNN